MFPFHSGLVSASASLYREQDQTNSVEQEQRYQQDALQRHPMVSGAREARVKFLGRSDGLKSNDILTLLLLLEFWQMDLARGAHPSDELGARDVRQHSGHHVSHTRGVLDGGSHDERLLNVQVHPSTRVHEHNHSSPGGRSVT